jgi:hypothetical protein
VVAVKLVRQVELRVEAILVVLERESSDIGVREDAAKSNRRTLFCIKITATDRRLEVVTNGDDCFGGHDDLRRYLGLKVADPKATTYQPVIALFSMTALMALAASFAVYGTPLTIRAGEWFIAFSMCILAMLKLQNVEKFATMFLNYDLLAKRWVPYSRIYPFAEGLAGVLMAAGALNWLSIPVALFIGSVGAASVFKAVYIDKRELKCACVGGDSNVPLGFVSLTENVMMVAMALWMLFGPHTMGF